MTLPTHVLLGAIIGKITGNYSLAIISSIAPDFDHFGSYIKSGVIKNPKRFWKTVTDENDPYGDQRGILHNLLFCVVASLLVALIFPKIGLVLTLGWLGHLTLDALDSSDYWPLYPSKKINLSGPIRYASIQEFLVFAVLLVIYFVI